jgi:AcrR family transcriptional regulator
MAATLRRARRGQPLPRPRRYHHGDLRRALLDAALRILSSDGVAALTLRETARRVGVSHAAPAHHFGDLAGLYAAIAEEGFWRLREHMLEAAGTAGAPGERVARYGVGYVAFATRHPGHFRAMFHPLTRERAGAGALSAVASETFALLLDGIIAAQAAGAMPAGSPHDLALAAWATVHGLATLAVDGQLAGKGFSSSDPVELARRLTRRASHGLGS